MKCFPGVKYMVPYIELSDVAAGVKTLRTPEAYDVILLIVKGIPALYIVWSNSLEKLQWRI